MSNENETVEVVDAKVVETKITPLQVLSEQQDNLRKQLEIAKSNMVKLQQQFAAQKDQALKLEGAIEAGELLLKSLSK